MELSRDVLVASRYQLVECLGAGAMGEVWRAQDTRFESRTVAVKFLREDETLKEDALNRDRLVIRLEQQAARGSLTVQSALAAIAAALGAGNLEGLRAKAEATLGSSGAFKPADVITVFGRRTMARMRFQVRKGRARRVYAELTEKVRVAQEAIRAAQPPPPAAAPEIPLPPPPPVA